MARMCIIKILFSISYCYYSCQFQLIFIVVSSFTCISVAMMSPYESFTDMKGDRFRFHLQVLLTCAHNLLLSLRVRFCFHLFNKLINTANIFVQSNTGQSIHHIYKHSNQVSVNASGSRPWQQLQSIANASIWALCSLDVQSEHTSILSCILWLSTPEASW